MAHPVGETGEPQPNQRLFAWDTVDMFEPFPWTPQRTFANVQLKGRMGRGGPFALFENSEPNRRLKLIRHPLVTPFYNVFASRKELDHVGLSVDDLAEALKEFLDADRKTSAGL